jgi:hypothetical protein
MTRIDMLTALVSPTLPAVGAEEQARLKKWRDAAEKAHTTGKMANTLAKALATRFSERWQFIDFRGPKGRESAGIVDILAIRKCGRLPTVPGLKRLDLFDIQLIQVKGGSAQLPTKDEIARLRVVQEHYRADRVILFQWVKGKMASFSTLEGVDRWKEASASELFGSKS